MKLIRCPECGSDFDPGSKDVRPPYCSTDCQADAEYRRAREESMPEENLMVQGGEDE